MHRARVLAAGLLCLSSGIACAAELPNGAATTASTDAEGGPAHRPTPVVAPRKAAPSAAAVKPRPVPPAATPAASGGASSHANRLRSLLGRQARPDAAKPVHPLRSTPAGHAAGSPLRPSVSGSSAGAGIGKGSASITGPSTRQSSPSHARAADLLGATGRPAARLGGAAAGKIATPRIDGTTVRRR
jgi:hypothetical protein